MTEEEKTIYALGLTVYKSLHGLDLTPAELKIVTKAMADSAAGKPEISLNEYGPKIEPFAKAREAKQAEGRKAESDTYLAKAAAAPGVVKTPTGLIYKELRAGTGASPTATDKVKVNYRGTFIDGTEFDSSYSRNEPVEFPLGNVIPCWTEGLQKMKVGGKAQLICPASIAYGDKGRPSIPGGSTLLFEVELLEINGTK
jgi:FKBP-type peptidyl-prolyl cis-trans isomerase FkpA